MILSAHTMPIHALVAAPAERYLDDVGVPDGIDLRLRSAPLRASDVAWADLVILEGWDLNAIQSNLPADIPVLVLLPTGNAIVPRPDREASAVAVPARRERLAAAIHAAAQGLAVRDLVADVHPEPAVAGEAERLTPREQEILRLLAQGKPNKAIAELLGVSDQTVKSHVSAILAKLHAQSRTEAVAIAARRGLVML